jgi:uncharacterized membrane protein
MSLYPWLLFLHILAAIVWIGGGLMLVLIAFRVRSSASPTMAAEFGRTLPYVALRGLTPAIAVLLLTGVSLVLTSRTWAFSQPWVLLALGLLVLAFLIGAIYLSRTGAALLRLAGEEGADVADGRVILNRWLLGYGVVLLILIVVVWDMIFKPGL